MHNIGEKQRTRTGARGNIKRYKKPFQNEGILPDLYGSRLLLFFIKKQRLLKFAAAEAG